MDITKVAHLARLDLSPAEIEKFGGQLEQILNHIEKLKTLDVEGIEPTAHTTVIFTTGREDEIQADRTLSQEAVLGNAPETAHSQIKMPKVIE